MFKTKNISKKIEQAAEAIRQADAIWIGAGAGMGVDSGLPDFRGNQGFWKEYPALREDGLSFADLANPVWFHHQPDRAWGFYGHRYMLYRDTEPHRGFSLLKKWSDGKPGGGFVYTSNVDGHFQKAGFAPEQVYEVHGSINHLQCVNGCCDDIWQEDIQLDIDHKTLVAQGELPKCRHCTGLARPNILMFGDCDWLHDRSHQQVQHYYEWKNKLAGKKVVGLEIGAGKTIATVRYAAQNACDKIIRINPREADSGPNVIPIPLGALEALNLIEESLNQ